MKVCAFARPTGSPCKDGWSKSILCEKNNEIHCLRDCMQGCSMYQEKPETVITPSPSPKYKPAPKQYHAFAASTSASSYQGSTVYKSGGCGSPCGGTAGGQQK